MFQGLGRHLRSVSHLIGKCSLFPVVMDYGLYPPPYLYTADQVPYQNMQVTHTIDLIGATSVHIKKQLGDAKQRFCTLQVTDCVILLDVLINTLKKSSKSSRMGGHICGTSL